MSTDSNAIKLPGTPKPWMNSVVMTLLRTPGVRSIMGKTFMILTVTGARSGRTYTMPVQYVLDGDRLLVLSQRTRRWWRNLPQRPEVEVVLRGRTVRTVARLADGDEETEVIATMLRRDPRTARFYGVAIDEDGEPDAEGVEQVRATCVAIVVDHAE